jgi:MFS family permease
MSSLWTDRRFSTYWAGQTVSQFGDRISELALPLIAVATLQASPTEVGLLTAAIWTPSLIALFIGAWVDHQARKRRLLIAADLLRFAVLLSLPIAHVLGVVSLGQLYLVALLAGIGQVLYQTSYANFFVALVRKDQYVEANSMLSGSRSASYIAGPAVGGFLIQALTAPVAVLVDALSFLVSAAMIGRVKTEERPVDTTGALSLTSRAREGMRFVLKHPYLRASLGCATTINFFNFVVNALVILYASRHLHLSAGVIGLAFGIGATGSLVGALVAGRLARAIGVGWTVAMGSIVFSLPYALIPLAAGSTVTKAGVLALVEFLAGLGIMCFDINLNALQTAVTPDAMRSRVVGAFTTINYGIRPLGAVVGGVCGQFFGIGPTMIVAAIGGALAFLWLLPSPIITTAAIVDLEPLSV